MKWIKSYCSLVFIEDYFRDSVSGKMVSIYLDCFGEYWIKNNRWALFRVKAKYTPKEEQ